MSSCCHCRGKNERQIDSPYFVFAPSTTSANRDVLGANASTVTISLPRRSVRHRTNVPLVEANDMSRRGGEGRGEFMGPFVYVFVFYKKDQLTCSGLLQAGGQRTRDGLRHFVGWPAERSESFLLSLFHSMKRHR